MNRIPSTPTGSRIVVFLLGALFAILFAHSSATAIVPDDYFEPRSDTTFARLVKQYTTDERFLSPIVGSLPESETVPSPRDFLGYVAGAPKKLTSYEKIKAYMEKLADSSPRVKLLPIGKSSEGREMILVLIADESTLGRIDEYAGYTALLADPRRVDETAAGKIIEKAKLFYYLTGGLHSPETGSPEMLMELAYRLAVGESPLVRRIRENIITMITPVLEVDGRERMVDWYYLYTVDVKDWKDSPPKSPPYWGHYTLHDNNRDGIQISQPLTRNLARTFFRFHPQVTHDLHESIPYLYISSGTGPYNENLDPIITSEWQWMANNEVTELTKLGMPGVWTWGFYTGWYPGYLLWFGNNHNSLGRFYETFGNAGATTYERELKESFAKRKITKKAWYRPVPPDKKVKWSFRNNINYQETGVLAALDFAAVNARTLLYNFWKKGNNAVWRGRTQPPYAWIIPAKGQKKYELRYLIGQLRKQGIDVHRLDEKVKLGGKTFAKGSFVVRMDQPYRDLAKSLLEKQRFPADAEYRPYDDVAWTLPLLYGVKAERIDDKDILDKKMSPVTAPVGIHGIKPRKKSKYYLIPASSTETFLGARFMLSDFQVYAADTSFSAAGRKLPRGTWIIPAVDRREELASIIETITDSLCLDVFGARSIPADMPRHLLDIPRIAVFHTWTFTQNSGWVRYTFDRAGIPYTLINKDQLREGGLRKKFDVILIPDLGSFFKPKDLVHGVDTKWRPMPYRSGPKSPNLGRIDETKDMTGGMGFAGLENLDEFVKAGGTLITLGGGSLIPSELGIVRHVSRVRPAGFMNPGSVLRVRILKPTSNITLGYDTLTTVFRGFSPLLSVPENYRRLIVMQYGTRLEKPEDEENHEGSGEKKRGDGGDKICVSGYVKGEKALSRKPAILDVRKGEGRVVIFTFNPLHRYLTHSNFALVNNAILHWND
jgi:hypothetical protein